MIDRTTVTSTGGAPAFRAIAGVENASGPSDGMAASLVAPGARALAPPAIAIAAGDPAVAGVAFAVPPGAGDCGAPAAPRSSRPSRRPPARRRRRLCRSSPRALRKGPAAHPARRLRRTACPGRRARPIPNCESPRRTARRRRASPYQPAQPQAGRRSRRSRPRRRRMGRRARLVEGAEQGDEGRSVFAAALIGRIAVAGERAGDGAAAHGLRRALRRQAERRHGDPAL